MKAFTCLLLLGLSFVTEAMQVQTFRSSDRKLKFFYGDTITILTDSAYLVSAAQALLINEKLMALQSAKQTNTLLIHEYTSLRTRISMIEKHVTKLLLRMEADHQLIAGDLSLLLHELDQNIAFLQQTNVELAANNRALEAQLQHMDTTVKHLRKTNRKMSWQTTRDKVLIGLLGLGTGLLIGR